MICPIGSLSKKSIFKQNKIEINIDIIGNISPSLLDSFLDKNICKPIIPMLNKIADKVFITITSFLNFSLNIYMMNNSTLMNHIRIPIIIFYFLI